MPQILMLSDFFSPLTPILVLATLLIFILLDMVGSFIDTLFIHSPSFLRPFIWIYGLSLTVFLWFVLHFSLPFDRNLVAASFLILFLISFPDYIKRRSWTTYLAYLRSNLLIPAAFVILLPALLIKSSLPPYLTDEVRYHLLSPFQLQHQLVWPFLYDFDLYTQIPRLFDTFFTLIFALTKSYSPARFLHFFIYFSSISAIYSWVKKYTSPLSAGIFLTLILFTMKDLLIIGTSGYLDYSQAAVTGLAIIVLVEAVLVSPRYLYADSIIWAIAIGNKYSPLSALLIYPSILLVYALFHNRGFLKHVFKPKTLLICLSLLILFGGYWYLKNIGLTRNPVYPFLFPCQVSWCVDVHNMFEGWTLPVAVNTLPLIFLEIFNNRSYLLFLLPISVFLALRTRNTFKSSLIVLFLLGVALELLVIYLSSGFIIRYFLYFQITLFILLVLPVERSRPYRWLLIIVAAYIFAGTIKTTYSPWNYLSPQEIAYARRKMDISTWLSDRHPQNQDIIRWCGQPGEKYLYIIDPAIWHATTNEQFMSVFNVSCHYLAPPLDMSKPFWFATTKNCPEEPLVCRSQPRGKNLYQFKPTSI